MNRQPSQPTLRDLLRPVVANRWLIVAVVVLAVGASIAYSATRQPVYTARASVAFQDQSRDLGLVGLAVAPTQTADQLASSGAQTILQRSVAAQVKQALHSPDSVDSLLGSVTATVEPSSNLVVIQATAPTAAGAQDLANAFASQGAVATNATARAQYAAAVKLLRRRQRKQSAGNRSPDTTTQAIYNEQLSRLQVLSTIANPAQVVDPAQRPAAPSSPRPLRNAMLAGVLGLILGLLIAYVRDSFDRRLRNVSEVEEEFALPMLGHVRDTALGRSPRVNGDRNVEGTDWELFRILRRNLDFLEPGEAARSVAVTSSLPEEGKSTVAAFLAFTSAAAGKRTLLIECDLRRPVFADRLGINSSPGVSDFVMGHAVPEEILQVVRFGDPISVNGAGRSTEAVPNGGATGVQDDEGQHAHQVVCITAGTPTQHPVEILRSESFIAMLRQVREVYDLVVLDTPPLLSVVDTLELLPHVDAAVICVRLFSTTRHQAGAGNAALKRLPDRPTGLVVTGTRRSAEAEYGYYGYYG